jgi:hypothetical protein
MNVKYQKLAAVLLEMASDEFANHGCNDVEESLFKDWTIEERKKLVYDFEKWNSGYENYEPDHLHIPDYALMLFFSHLLTQESNVSSQEPSIEDFRDQVLKVICENRDAIIRASNDRMTALEVFETKNCFAAVINTYEDLFEIITVLKPNGDQTAQEPDTTASKEIGEPLVQNKSNQ